MAPRQPVLPSLHAEVDRRRQRVEYRDAAGRLLFTDTGPRIEVHDPTAPTLEAALRVGAQKYGGSVTITGSADFREQATRTAARLGVTVRDPDLQPLWREEREKGQSPAGHRAHDPCRNAMGDGAVILGGSGDTVLEHGFSPSREIVVCQPTPLKR